MVNRLANYPKNNSFFLFGARGTGKTTWLKEIFKSHVTLWIDLLNPSEEEKYLLEPEYLKKQILALIEAKKPLDWVVIDEIQKCPKLLNIVHQLIEEHKIKFALTGSSSRRLKQKGTNLLAGRAFVRYLFPLTHVELDQNFDLKKALHYGMLPQLEAYDNAADYADYLSSYIITYVKKEIQEEQWVRKVEPFRKFLPIAAQMNGRPLNYSSIAQEVGVDHNTVKSYFEILEDTLMGFHLNSYHSSIRKQQRVSPKFYFFDVGVKRQLEKKISLELHSGTSEFGYAFEHFIILECVRLNQYLKLDFEFYYLLTKDNVEIDLIIEKPDKSLLLIEIKSKDKVDEKDCRHLESLLPEFKNAKSYLLSNHKTALQIKNTQAVYWQDGLKLFFNLSSAK